MPSAGFFMILGVIFIDLIRPRITRPQGIFLIAGLSIFYAIFTIGYGRTWQDSSSIFKNTIKYEIKSPHIYTVYNNLGWSYYYEEKHDEAIHYYKKSISSYPEYAAPYDNLGVSYMVKGEYVRAMSFFKKSISVQRDFLKPYYNLANAYYGMGFKDKALKILSAALKISPDSHKTHHNLGLMYLYEGDVDKALYEYKRALDLGSRPDYIFFNEIGSLYAKSNLFIDAEKAYLASLSLNKVQSSPHNNLGNIYSMFGYFDRAIEEYEAALSIEPTNKKMRDNLIKTKAEWKAILLKRLGEAS